MIFKVSLNIYPYRLNKENSHKNSQKRSNSSANRVSKRGVLLYDE